MAKSLLKRGASRMARDNEGHTPLHLAACVGHLRCVIVLIGRADNLKMTHAEVNATNVRGATALHLAASEGNEKICGLLIEAGARLDAETTPGQTPLAYAQHSQPTNAALHALLSGAGPAHLPGTVCDHCGKSPAQASVPYLKTCGACQSVRYCCAACSAAAWRGHKAACQAHVAELAARTGIEVIDPLSSGQ
jgi:Ankyrin repeats (3 copies)/MYND finger